MEWMRPIFNFFPTMLCNNNCNYCTNTFHIKNRNNIIIPGDKWVEKLQRLTGVHSIIISGGEPALHPDFVYIVDNLQRFRTIIYTNGSQLEKFKQLEIRDNLVIDISYHFGQQPIDDIIELLKYLKSKEIKHSCYAIDNINNRFILEKYSRILKNHGLQFGLKPLDGKIKGKWYSDHTEENICLGKIKKVLCKTLKYPVGPDGSIYQCHKFLYDNNSRGIIQNIFENEDYIPIKFRECDLYGRCNPCESHQIIKKINEEV